MFYERLSRQHGWALARRRRATRANARDWRGETKTLGPHRALIVTARGELRPNSNHQRRISHFEHHVTLTLAVCAVCHGLRCLCPRRHWLLVASPRRRRPPGPPTKPHTPTPLRRPGCTRSTPPPPSSRQSIRGRGHRCRHRPRSSLSRVTRPAHCPACHICTAGLIVHAHCPA